VAAAVVVIKRTSARDVSNPSLMSRVLDRVSATIMSQSLLLLLLLPLLLLLTQMRLLTRQSRTPQHVAAPRRHRAHGHHACAPRLQREGSRAPHTN
jgi:hypothetical protein